MLGHVRGFHSWQVSKLDQFVTVQYEVINIHRLNVHDTIDILHDQGQAAICHLSEDQRFHHMEEEMEEDKAFHGDTPI
jgi:hypothetical protein